LAGCVAVTAVALGVTLLTAAGAEAIAHAYAGDARLVELSAAALVLASPFFVPDALQVVLAQALRARGDVLVPTFIHVACYAAGMLPLGWWLAHPRGLGLSGCVWAVLAASFAAAGLLTARFVQVTWRGPGRS
jgi:MATE family multidrug resistance protein